MRTEQSNTSPDIDLSASDFQRSLRKFHMLFKYVAQGGILEPEWKLGRQSNDFYEVLKHNEIQDALKEILPDHDVHPVEANGEILGIRLGKDKPNKKRTALTLVLGTHRNEIAGWEGVARLLKQWKKNDFPHDLFDIYIVNGCDKEGIENFFTRICEPRRDWDANEYIERKDWKPTISVKEYTSYRSYNGFHGSTELQLDNFYTAALSKIAEDQKIKQTIDAINNVLGAELVPPLPHMPSKEKLISILAPALEKKYSDWADKFEPFLRDLQNPEIKLPNDHPLLKYENWYNYNRVPETGDSPPTRLHNKLEKYVYSKSQAVIGLHTLSKNSPALQILQSKKGDYKLRDKLLNEEKNKNFLTPTNKWPSVLCDLMETYPANHGSMEGITQNLKDALRCCMEAGGPHWDPRIWNLAGNMAEDILQVFLHRHAPAQFPAIETVADSSLEMRVYKEAGIYKQPVTGIYHPAHIAAPEYKKHIETELAHYNEIRQKNQPGCKVLIWEDIAADTYDITQGQIVANNLSDIMAGRPKADRADMLEALNQSRLPDPSHLGNGARMNIGDLLMIGRNTGFPITSHVSGYTFFAPNDGEIRPDFKEQVIMVLQCPERDKKLGIEEQKPGEPHAVDQKKIDSSYGNHPEKSRDPWVKRVRGGPDKPPQSSVSI